jgi:hypothetical protein
MYRPRQIKRGWEEADVGGTDDGLSSSRKRGDTCTPINMNKLKTRGGRWLWRDGELS